MNIIKKNINPKSKLSLGGTSELEYPKFDIRSKKKVIKYFISIIFKCKLISKLKIIS